MLNTAYDEGQRPPVRDPHRGFGLGVVLYVGCPDVDAAYEHLRAHGVDVKPPKVAPYTLCFQWQAT